VRCLEDINAPMMGLWNFAVGWKVDGIEVQVSFIRPGMWILATCILNEIEGFAEQAGSHVLPSRGRFAMETWKRGSGMLRHRCLGIEGNEWLNHL
jgi:hypothetical protein